MNKYLKKLRNFKEYMLGYPYLKKRFKKKLEYSLDLNNPKSFNQKIQWKKVNDRNPLLPITADKYKVRDYVKNRLGKKTSENILIPLLYATKQPEKIPFTEMTCDFIVKANHGSGTNIVVKNNDYDLNKIINKCNRFLRQDYGFRKFEWSYRQIDRLILVEKLLDVNGDLPLDYKFHFIHGKCEYIHIDMDRQGEHKRCLYKPDWTPLNVRCEYSEGEHIEKPETLEEMLAYGKILSEPFDFVRVDFYSIKNKVYFGEITHYPGSGFDKYEPLDFDYALGVKWNLKKGYWNK